MKTRHAFRSLATALILNVVALTGCAGTTMGGGAGGEGAAAVEVRNNLIPPTSLSIYTIPTTGGGQRLIGIVSPSETKILRFDPALASASFRFRAEPNGGSAIISNEVTVGTGDTVRWDLSSNIAIIVESGGG